MGQRSSSRIRSLSRSGKDFGNARWVRNDNIVVYPPLRMTPSPPEILSGCFLACSAVLPGALVTAARRVPPEEANHTRLRHGNARPLMHGT